MKKKITEEKMFLQQMYSKRFYEKEMRYKVWQILTADFFQKFIPSKSTVLDIPTGYGEFIVNIKAKEKIAIDLNPDSKKFLPKNVRFIETSSDKILLPKESVDIIFVSNFFEHITKDIIQHTLKEFYRILRPKGKVMVLQPNIRFLQLDYWMFFDHITPIDDRALDEVFDIHHMKMEYKVERFLPYTMKSKFPKALWLIKLYLKLPFMWRLLGKQSFIIYSK